MCRGLSTVRGEELFVSMLSLFITLIAFAISANAVAPLISTLSGDIGVQASSFGIFITVQFLSFSAASFLGGFIKERLRLSNYHLVGAGLLVIARHSLRGRQDSAPRSPSSRG